MGFSITFPAINFPQAYATSTMPCEFIWQNAPNQPPNQLQTPTSQFQVLSLPEQFNGIIQGPAGGSNMSPSRSANIPDLQDSRYVLPMNPRYHDGLIEFKKRCTDYQIIMGFLTGLIENDVAGIKSFLKTQAEVHATDIGCGDGTITSHLASLIVRFATGMELIVVEPLKSYIDQTRNKLKGVNVVYVQQKAEEFFATHREKSSDLILSSHSLHFISLDAVSQITNTVNIGGYFVVVIGARSSIMSLLKDMFAPKPAITGEDVLHAIQQNSDGRQFEAAHLSIPSQLDLRDIKLPDKKENLNEVAKNLLSLMIQKNIDDIGEEDYAKIKQEITGRTHNGILQLDNDGFVFRRRL